VDCGHVIIVGIHFMVNQLAVNGQLMGINDRLMRHHGPVTLLGWLYQERLFLPSVLFPRAM
jgi:hypothetical protein